MLIRMISIFEIAGSLSCSKALLQQTIFGMFSMYGKVSRKLYGKNFSTLNFGRLAGDEKYLYMNFTNLDFYIFMLQLKLLFTMSVVRDRLLFMTEIPCIDHSVQRSPW